MLHPVLDDPTAFPVVTFANKDICTLHRAESATVFKIHSAPRLVGGSYQLIATIVFNDAAPKLLPDHLQAIVDFIRANN